MAAIGKLGSKVRAGKEDIAGINLSKRYIRLLNFYNNFPPLPFLLLLT